MDVDTAPGMWYLLKHPFGRKVGRPVAQSGQQMTLGLDGAEPARSGFGDSAFTGNRAEPVHRWVPWIAGFASGFVNDVLDRVSSPPGRVATVLDPFAGVGTTLVEALRRGHRALGFEINPYAALACRAKLRLGQYGPGRLRERTEALARYIERERATDETPQTPPPVGFRSRAPFFSPSIERQVLHVLDFVSHEDCPLVADLIRVALGATMVSFSNYS